MVKPNLPLSLYIHIPWCVEKCPYCDFNSHKLISTPDFSHYITHLLNDLEQDISLINGRPIQSIFIGGGTPSLLKDNHIDCLLSEVGKRITLNKDAEITLEANPNSTDHSHFQGYAKAGVNRISLGVQSFSENQLKKLGRIHDPYEAHLAADLTNSLNLNSFNLDLMHGLPGQTLEEALLDLDKAIKISPPHLSWYQLTIEPNTLFGSKPPELPNEDTLWEIYQMGHNKLIAAGYQHYETSAYAKPGYQCQHNLNYWRFGDYIGIGCGAHGKLTQTSGDIIRTVKTRHPQGYLTGNYLAKKHSVRSTDRPFEYFMNRFRLHEPTPKAEFCMRTFLSLHTITTPIKKAIVQGYITEDDTHWYLTERGKRFLNTLLLLFL